MVHLLNPLSHFVDMADRALKVGIVGYGHLGEFSNENFCFKSHNFLYFDYICTENLILHNSIDKIRTFHTASHYCYKIVVKNNIFIFLKEWA